LVVIYVPEQRVVLAVHGDDVVYDNRALKDSFSFAVHAERVLS
jgi:hypothetical protein